MSAMTILIVFILLFSFEFLWELLLTLLNIASVRRNRAVVPVRFRGAVPEETYRRSAEYTLAKSRFSIMVQAITSALTLTVVVSGLLGRFDLLLGGLSLHRYLHGVLYVLGAAGVSGLVSLPFAWHSQFGIEQRFGFNRMTPALFLADVIRSILVSVALAVPVLLGLFLFMDTAGGLWWLYAAVFVTVLQLALTVLYPLVIAPLFNTFTPLPEGSLREKIEDLARGLEFKTNGIFVMDSSRRSKHSNAYFTGIGKAKRIVLYDTLVNGFSEDEVVSVLAHEIGHEKMRHVVKRLAVSTVLTFLMFRLLALVLPYEPLYRAFGFAAPSYHALLVILALASGPLTFAFTPLFSFWSRKHEYEADRFAAEAAGTPRHLTGALLRLGTENLSNLTPHPLYSFYHYSHPTLAERLAALESAGKGKAV